MLLAFSMLPQLFLNYKVSLNFCIISTLSWFPFATTVEISGLSTLESIYVQGEQSCKMIATKTIMIMYCTFRHSILSLMMCLHSSSPCQPPITLLCSEMTWFLWSTSANDGESGD